MADRGPDQLEERVRSQTQWFGALILGLLLLSQTSLPWRMGGLAVAVAVLWVGTRLLAGLAAMRRLGRRRAGWLGVSAGLGFAMLMLIQLGAEAAIYPVVADRERCERRASSLTARGLCEQEYERRLTELTTRLRGG